MKKKANIVVKRRRPQESNERLIRNFLKKAKKERIVEECRERKHYKKPSIKKREKREKAHRARLRDEAKRLKALQRRHRNNK